MFDLKNWKRFLAVKIMTNEKLIQLRHHVNSTGATSQQCDN